MAHTELNFPNNPWVEYMRDAMERSVLFLDILRQRGNNYEEQIVRVAPNVLSFSAEVISDGRSFERPVNYALVRITPPEGVVVDPRKRPFIVFDPRAGHGPGIGGMKHDSEIGVALQAGHPCYFVGFLPEPMPGQTVEDVCRAEAEFIRTVAELHPEAEGKPTLIGNCQAGWQIMITAALDPEIAGPILLAGAPLSYWAGVRGKNPMRYLGGNLGGSWMTSLTGDVGDGKFDGAWLVSNFESNNLANTLWKKQYNVYSKVDTEGPRYLEFEKWWGVPVQLNAEEMQFIVDELFVGNHLTAGETIMSDGARVDLRKIRSPIIVFCSWGDDITPPQQALDWVTDLYDDVDQIIQNGQTIIYCLHQSIGHLGIFVSGSVATKEHEEITLNMEMIDSLLPGLYELELSELGESVENRELIGGKHLARLVPRTLDDIRALGHNSDEDERKFAASARVSEINQGLYRSLVSPFVRAFSTPTSAEILREMHPNRIAYRIFSDRNPVMSQVAEMAENIRADGQRHPVSPDNLFLQYEKFVSSWVTNSLEIVGKAREVWAETMFHSIYGSPVLQAAVGLKSDHARNARRASGVVRQIDTSLDLEADQTKGGLLEAGMRALIYVLHGSGVDERQFNALEQIYKAASDGKTLSVSALKAILRRQATLLRADPERAMAAIPRMLSEDAARNKAVVETIEKIVGAKGKLEPVTAQRLKEIRVLFGVDGRATPIRKVAG
ncbi:Protein of unknown function [Paracoccus halophilus]|uniref:3-hydroxyalkanoate synthetase n=1 Tax=Paracoccus halophilus TaxID=376733 RepID=A0A099F6W0_9RHOB|nr:DUF3141 domain-containing protein [Paracoccus halophilus]KGJ06445.1 hypothetical protein IT41_02050 [Paracoccus halophilus]SFA38264.1 Protein of unknown function [Paracoccus halophilus]